MSRVACRRSDCTGHIDEGYCDLCGLAEQRREELSPMSTGARKGTTSAEGAESLTFTATCRAPPVAQGLRTGRRTLRAGQGSVRKQLGGGLISVPELPSIEPERAVLQDLTVPAYRRFCSRCDAALRRATGFCGKCGTRYSFEPTLRAGDVVADQYEVRGPLAYGGLGWIYLAFDRLLWRYVVLKGMLNAQDKAAAALAVAERQFLAAVKHPNIVAIYNFVESAGEGFIVMEYVGGRTLKEVRQQRGPLPAAEAIAYVHRVLPAFAYLHRMGLVFCDFKPENVMLEHDELKLIDLGGVRAVEDTQGDVYGTVGYSAPEAAEGPTPASDLFTVGRTLAVLLTEIPGFARERRYTLPAPEENTLFAEQESLYRFLLKATAERAQDRFATAEEMAEQLGGVFREVVATETGVPRPEPSQAFGADLLALEAGEGVGPVWPEARYLPVPSLDPCDAGTQAVTAAMASAGLERRLEALRLLCRQSPESREAPLRLAVVLMESGALAEAERLLVQLEAEDPWDWRTLWFRARLHLRQGHPLEARGIFDQICSDLPGELAPKLGWGLAAELGGELAQAERMYAVVVRVDPAMASAVFGLARCLRGQGRTAAAVEVLERVPPSSVLFARAQAEAIRMLLGPKHSQPQLADVLCAATMAERLPLEERSRLALQREVYEAAVAAMGKPVASDLRQRTLFGVKLEDRALRLALERALRGMAALAQGDERVALLEEANRARPRTLF